MTVRSESQSERIQARYVASLSLAEIGLGSALHALHVPMTGQLLSLNQVYLLSRGVLRNPDCPDVRLFPFRISIAASLLKSLAPAGKKLTPMLAIAMQGILFGLPIYLLGARRIPVAVGAAISALWAYIQPILIYSLIFGQSLIEVGGFYLREFERFSHLGARVFVIVVASIIAIKVLLAIGLSWMAASRVRFRLPHPSVAPVTSSSSRIPRDLKQPFFWLSLGLVLLYGYYSGIAVHSLALSAVRSVAIVFILYFGFRLLPLRAGGVTGRILEKALRTLPASSTACRGDKPLNHDGR